MKKLLISISLLFSTVFAADALIKTITDGNFVFEVDTENGTAELLRLVNNDIADLQIPRVAHDGSTQFLVNELGNQALNGCSKIKSLVITDNITMLYKDAFLGCTSLTEIEFQESSRNLTLLSEWDDTGDHKLLGDSPLEKIIFNRPCSNLKPYAPFKGKPTLREAYLGKELGTVPNSMFADCENLEKAVLDEGITQLERNAFSGCTSLASVTLPSSLKIIENFAFENCSSLPVLNLPADVTNIPTGMCRGCTSLLSITIPEGTVYIHSDAFRNCSAAKSLTFNGSPMAIEKSAFKGCSSIEDIRIPDMVQSIADEAFNNCPNVKRLYLPASLISIGQQAFCNCESLAEITCDAVQPPIIECFTFSYVDKTTCRLNIPEASTEAYRTAPYWNEFFTTDGINSINQDSTGHDQEWYTLDGLKLPSRPGTRGIYILRQGNTTRTHQVH